MTNYVEVLLWSEEQKEAYLIGKYADNISKLLDDIAVVQNLNCEIAPYFEISIKEIAMILIDKFGCISNLINKIDTIKNNKNIRFDKYGHIPIDDLDLVDNHYIISDLKNINSFVINISNLWDNYSIWRYQEDQKNILKQYIENKKLCNRIKTFIYYGIMNVFIENISNLDNLNKELDNLQGRLFPSIKN